MTARGPSVNEAPVIQSPKSAGAEAPGRPKPPARAGQPPPKTHNSTEQSLGWSIHIGLADNAHNAYKIEVLSCYFEDPPEGCEQFIRLEGASTATIDNCLFAGNPGTPASGPDRAIEVIGSSFVRCSSNTMQGFKTEILNFDVDSKNCVEMCNRDLDAATVARITAGSLSVFGTSQQSVTLPRYSADGSKPAANTLRPGSMIWVVSPTNPSQSLQVSDGTNWIGI
jgi:hypothetical protein